MRTLQKLLLAFDLICSDLSTFPVARACAASSAVPILLTPITLLRSSSTP
jgi:NTE family protein